MVKKTQEPGRTSSGGAGGGADSSLLLDKLCELVDAEEANNEAVLECLAELKLLTAANNDALALAEILASLQAVCDKLLAQADQNTEILTALEALCDKLLTTNESLAELCEKIESGQEAELACLEEIKAALEQVIEQIGLVCEKLDGIQETLDSVICPKPQCAVEGSVPVTYTNADDETELTVSVGSLGNVKIDSGSGDGSDAEITQYITDCLAAGNDVMWEATGVEGESASGVLVAAAETNAFPNFFNDSTGNAPAVAFKVSSMTATCLETVEEAGVTLKTYDQCTVDALNASLSVQEETLVKLCDVIGECEDACAQSAVIGFCGRPANEAEYSYGGVTESTLEAFNAAWEAQGGKTWIAAEDGVSGGECHWFCPAVTGSTFTVNGEAPANGNVVVSPNPNAEALGCEATAVFNTLGCRDDAILAALNTMAEQSELQTAKLCVIEQNSNPAAACSKPVEGLDKEALTLTLSGDVTENYPAGQAIDLQNANAESCGSATSAGGAKYDAENDVTIIPIEECELDEGKEPAVIKLAQPVKAITATAIKTIKTLTAVSTLTPIRSVTEFNATSFKSDAGAFMVGDRVQLMSADRLVLGTATIAKVSETDYAISDSTVSEVDIKNVALAQKVTK